MCSRNCFGLFVVVGLALGVSMIIVGVELLGRPNTREEDVAAFEAEAAAYRSKTLPLLLEISELTVNGDAMERVLEPVTIVGDRSGVKEVTHVFFRRNRTASTGDRDAAPPADGPYAFRAEQDAGGVTGFTADMATKSVIDADLRCGHAPCPDVADCGTCLRDRCVDSYGGIFTAAANRCTRRGKVCGVCAVSGSVTDACVVVVVSATGSLSRSPKLADCRYPFAAHTYAPPWGEGDATDTLSVSLVAANDPFISLQRLTKGTRDFGVTEEAQRAVAEWWIALGSTTIAAVLIAAAAVVLWRRRREQRAVAHEANAYVAARAEFPAAAAENGNDGQLEMDPVMNTDGAGAQGDADAEEDLADADSHSGAAHNDKL